MSEIVIEVVYDQGGEEMGLYAKGHHDKAAMREAIMVAVAGEIALDVDEPPALKEIRHEWWRNGPGDGGDLAFIFVQAKEGEPGAYPVTCWPLDGGMDGGPSGLASAPAPSHAAPAPHDPSDEGRRCTMADAGGWTFTKRQVEQYEFHGPHGMWAIVTLDPRGIIQAVSDVGDYAYEGWGHHGCESFKHFLVSGLDVDYFLGKVADGREFSFERTQREYRRRILDERRGGSLAKDEARAAWDEIEEIQETADATHFVCQVMQDCPALYGHVFGNDPCATGEACVEVWPAWALRFYHEVFLGHLVPVLRAELGLEARAQEANHAA